MKRVANLITCMLPAISFVQARNVPPMDRPSIVFILADDLGYEALGVYGSADYETPHLNKMAAKGMLFNNCFRSTFILSHQGTVADWDVQ